jgi:hypothetical protein
MGTALLCIGVELMKIAVVRDGGRGPLYGGAWLGSIMHDMLAINQVTPRSYRYGYVARNCYKGVSLNY